MIILKPTFMLHIYRKWSFGVCVMTSIEAGDRNLIHLTPTAKTELKSEEIELDFALPLRMEKKMNKYYL